jgi:membrane associated rhomboid family serine protease
VQLAVFADQVLPDVWRTGADARRTLIGGALNPFIWLTTDFLHGDLLRFGANLVFFWTFGLIVEGKLGWYVFVPLYAALGVAYTTLVDYAAVELAQFVTPHVERAATLGSSAAVYALAAMTLVWCPANSVRCFAWIWLAPCFYELPIWLVALGYVAFDAALAWLGGLPPQSLAVSLAGAALGAAAALIAQLVRLVDCQGWDLLSVLVGRHGDVDLDEMRKYRHPPRETTRDHRTHWERKSPRDDNGRSL